jgi:ArsR family metal-binding transcriptional regulator
MEANLSSIGISHTKFMIYKLRMVMKCLCGKKKLRLLHRIACRLKIHNINGSLIPNDKNLVPSTNYARYSHTHPI